MHRECLYVLSDQLTKPNAYSNLKILRKYTKKDIHLNLIMPSWACKINLNSNSSNFYTLKWETLYR